MIRSITVEIPDFLTPPSLSSASNCRHCALLHTLHVPHYPFAGSRLPWRILFSSYRPPSFIYLRLMIVQPFQNSFFRTMASADFSQFVDTMQTFRYCLLICTCKTSPGKSNDLHLIYLLHLRRKARAISDFVLDCKLVHFTTPYMQLLFVKPRFCP